MHKIEAKKDGKGNIIISEDSFEMILACLDNQKFVGEKPQNGDSISVGEDNYWKDQEDIQNVIDHYNRECRKILHQKYVLRTEYDGYFLVKRYEHQEEDTKWSSEDVRLVNELFKDTKIVYDEKRYYIPFEITEEIVKDNNPNNELDGDFLVVKPESTPWLIERPLTYDYYYLSISENGTLNRPWKEEEIQKITEILNSK